MFCADVRANGTVDVGVTVGVTINVTVNVTVYGIIAFVLMWELELCSRCHLLESVCYR